MCELIGRKSIKHLALIANLFYYTPLNNFQKKAIRGRKQLLQANTSKFNSFVLASKLFSSINELQNIIINSVL